MHPSGGKTPTWQGRGTEAQQTNESGQQLKPTGSPIEMLVGRLTGLRKTGRGWSCKCAAHDDRNASQSIAEGADGRVLLKCFAGCEPSAIVHALGLELRDLFPHRLPDLSREGRAASRLASKQAGRQAA